MTRHSPGPWRWTGAPSGAGRLEDAKGKSVAVGKGDVHNYGCSIDEYIEVWEEIDARLIAAAPEMLALLRENRTGQCEAMGCRYDDGGPEIVHVDGCPFFDVLQRIDGKEVT